MKTIRLSKFIGIIGLLLMFYACKSTKQTAAPETFRTLSSTVQMTLPAEKKGKEFSADAQLRILKGEAIQLSFRIPLLGTEAFKVVVTPDKLLIIDRLHKLYFSETMENVQANADFDFDYYQLENQLTNQLFVPGKNEISPVKKKMVFPVAGDRYTMDLLYKTIDLNTIFSIDGNYPERYRQITLPEAIQLIQNLL